MCCLYSWILVKSEEEEEEIYYRKKKKKKSAAAPCRLARLASRRPATAAKAMTHSY